MNTHPLTGSQTVGPFFAPCLLRTDACRNILVQPETIGEHIRIEGHVFDGAGMPIPDAMIEIWQANATGLYMHTKQPLEPTQAESGTTPIDSTFTGFGRSGTDEDGRYWFETVKPGPVPFNDGRMQAPHICVTIFARGLLNHLATRLYFADEPANAQDPVLQCVPRDRQTTLLAVRGPHTTNTTISIYHFDIILQGVGETAFFNI